MRFRRPYTGRVFLILAFIGIGLCFASINHWSHRRIIDWDISHYYSYLPASFIYKNYNFNDSTSQWNEAHFRLIPLEEGGKSAKMTGGVAIMASPFFIVAHAIATYSSSYEADGFSEPYKWSLVLAALFYTLLGLWFMGRWLEAFFMDKTVALVMACVFLGTNLLFYTVVEPMSHAYGFGLVNLMLFWFFRYRESSSKLLAISLGITLGFLFLIRPTNIIIALLPMCILLLEWKHYELSKLLRHLVLVLIAAFVVQVPQLLYWKSMTGHWLVYSYQGEGFFFNDPKIWDGLFSYRKGWFVYSPILFFTLPGFYYLYRANRHTFFSLLVTLFLGFWVVFSWWCWWYGGSFGARSLIEYLPLMSLPLGYTIQHLLSAKKLYRNIGIAALSVLTLWSLFLSHRYVYSMVHHDGMTKELYWAQPNLEKAKTHYYDYLDRPDYDKALEGIDR